MIQRWFVLSVLILLPFLSGLAGGLKIGLERGRSAVEKSLDIYGNVVVDLQVNGRQTYCMKGYFKTNIADTWVTIRHNQPMNFADKIDEWVKE